MPYIAPTKQSYYLELFDEPDISYTKEQDLLLENGLEYLKLGELDRSMEILVNFWIQQMINVMLLLII